MAPPKGFIPWNKGKTGVYSSEVRQAMGASMRGKKASNETRRKLSLLKRGRRLSEEWKKNISLGHNPMQLTKKERYKIVMWKKKKAVFDYYGWECKCCGETIPQFLTIDHVNNDGAKVKKYGKRLSGHILYHEIIKENFPSKYRILCWNCNSGRHMNKGVCPHEIIY